jgi:hypothetical protein
MLTPGRAGRRKERSERLALRQIETFALRQHLSHRMTEIGWQTAVRLLGWR